MARPEIYTLDFCLEEVKEFTIALASDASILTWHDLIQEKPYSRQRISEWREKFKDNAEFSDTIKKIEEELENRLYKYALTNKVNSTVAIFGLKNNYSWKDKHETEHTGGVTLNFPKEFENV